MFTYMTKLTIITDYRNLRKIKEEKQFIVELQQFLKHIHIFDDDVDILIDLL